MASEQDFIELKTIFGNLLSTVELRLVVVAVDQFDLSDDAEEWLLDNQFEVIQLPQDCERLLEAVECT